MNVLQSLIACTAAVCLTALSTLVLAQGPGAEPGAPGGPGGRGGGGRGAFVPEPVPPPQNFATSTEHYDFLFKLHKGGTRHTYDTVPKWEGLWSAAGNTSSALFVRPGPPPQGARGDGAPAAGAPGGPGGVRSRLFSLRDCNTKLDDVCGDNSILSWWNCGTGPSMHHF
jgi:hypothetical protein